MTEQTKRHSLSDCYKFFKEKYDISVSKKEYRSICYDFNKEIVKDVLKGRVTKLPYYLGALWGKKFKSSKLQVDFAETKRLGKTIVHLNEHSDGYSVRWAWEKKNNLITNLKYYTFVPSRENARALSGEVKKPDGHKKYFK